jgi:fructose-1,6-bisphosphatase/inositol monophosphatase family enzyme
LTLLEWAPIVATTAMPNDFTEIARGLLCRLGETIRDRVMEARLRSSPEELSAVAGVTAADTIYAVDRVGEEAILGWFAAHWSAAEPVEVVMEGLEDGETLTFPRGTAVAATRWKVILDPIDGTRNLMYDKRPAWSLAALAPQRGAATHLGDLVVAVMTELPTTKQWRSDQLSAVRGRGLRTEAMDLVRGGRRPLELRPSASPDFRNGFASVVKFFPEGKALTARLEEELWRRVLGGGGAAPTPIFDDQYLCSGGQIYELLAGRDRMVADLRPLVFKKLGLASPLACHPYDICTALLLQEAGGVVEQPDGSPLAAPLDTTSPVAWVGYANAQLAAQVRPVLRKLCAELLGGR